MKTNKLMIGIAFLIAACNSTESDTKENKVDSSFVNIDSAMQQSLSNDEINAIIQSMPSPVEFSSLIESSGAKYDENFLNGTPNSSKYNSQFSKAINLGIYGADLGYVNIYEKTFSAIDYLNTVYQLSTDLNIGDYFDFSTLKRLATNNKNIDSIVYITTKSFERMHNELQKSGNSQISTLILIGGWIEGMNLTCHIIDENSNSPKTNELMLTVYDEHLVLEEIIKLSGAFNANPNFKALTTNLQKIKDVYDKIVNTETEISAAQYNLIAKEIYSVRNELIK